MRYDPSSISPQLPVGPPDDGPDSDGCDDAPTVVVLKKGDLTQEEVDEEKKRIERGTSFDLLLLSNACRKKVKQNVQPTLKVHVRVN